MTDTLTLPAVKPQAAVFDLDGTLCDVRSIRHLVNGVVIPRQFDEFHRRSEFCPCHRWVVEAAANQARRGRVVLIATGRMERWRPTSTRFLDRFAVPFTAMFMRQDEDYRTDVEVKTELRDQILQAYDLVAAWEDQPTLAEQVWRPRVPHVTLVPGWGE